MDEIESRLQAHLAEVEARFIERLDAERDRMRERLEDLQRIYSETIKCNREVAEADVSHIRELSDQAFRASQVAIDKMEAATDKRFDSLAEFRGQLQEQVNAMLPREIFDTFQTDYRLRHEDLATRIVSTMQRITEIEARTAGSQTQQQSERANRTLMLTLIGVTIAAAGLIITFIVTFNLLT